MSKNSLVNAIKSLIPSMVFILTLSLPSWSQHKSWIGKVVDASDGDTITVMHNCKAEKSTFIESTARRSDRPLAKLEAFNATIARIVRRVCGYRDLDYQFLKIR